MPPAQGVHQARHQLPPGAADLAEALRRAAAAHGRHEAETGQPDPDWPDWYAQSMADESAGAGA